MGAVTADRVVVELIAQNSQFDAAYKQSAAGFVGSTNQITDAAGKVETAANDVYTAHNRMGIATNNARIAQMELQHVIRGSVDSYASGGSAVQIFAQHIASVAEAATFMGGSLGAVGEILAGPWGIAITAGVAILATLISKHKEEAATVDSLVEKLKKHHDQTLMQNQADEIWSNTLDGLIDRLNKLNEAGAKQLVVKSVTNTQDFAEAEAHVDHIQKQIDAAEAKGQDTTKLYTALSAAVIQLYQKTITLGQQQGEVYSDLTKRAQTWAEAQHAAMFGETATINGKDRTIAGLFGHPELAAFAGELQGAFEKIKAATEDAAKGNVPFDAVTRQVDALNNKLADSPGFIKDYITSLRQLAAQLENTVETAKNAPKAISDFEKAVIGAEGTGRNPKSSAYGYGQFLAQDPNNAPTEWQSYFRKLFPDQAKNLTAEAIDDLRTNKDVATAIISAATEDYVKVLKAAGQQITEAGLYTVHVLGAGDARKFFSASPDQSVLSALGGGAHARAVVNNNGSIFTGTVGQATSALAQRIGDGSSSVSAAAMSLQRAEDDLLTKAGAVRDKEAEVTVAKEHQVAFTEQLLHGNETLAEFVQTHIVPGLKDWNKEYQQIIDSMAEANRFGAQLVDDILNPDNWQSWGDAGKKVLHEILQEILLLGAANPLKNLLFGSHLPTLGSIFGQLFGGGGGGLDVGAIIAGGTGSLAPVMPLPTAPPLKFASGGAFKVNGGTDTNLLSINGQPRAMVSGDETIGVFPSNAVAANAGGGRGSLTLRVIKGDLFDVIVEGTAARVAAPMVVQGSVAAANGGASIARRNLGRESMHRLE